MRAIRHSLILRQANSRRGISALPETVRPARRIPRFNRPATGTVRFRWRRPPVRAHPQVRRPHPAAALDHRLALPGAFLGLKPVHERSMRYGSAHGASWDDVHRFEGAAMASRPELRCRQLIETLHDEYSELGVTDLRHIGEGMDANVYRAHSAELGSITIKIPHSRWMSTGNEPRLDTRVVLRKEFQSAGTCGPTACRHRKHSSCTPTTLALILSSRDSLNLTAANYSIQSSGASSARYTIFRPPRLNWWLASRQQMSMRS